MIEPGLCGRCAHARIVTSRRGSRFWLCGLSRVDRRFPRYPALPVLRCVGHVAGAPATAEENQDIQSEAEQ